MKVWVQTTEAKKQNDFNSVEKSAVETVTRLAEAKIAARDATRPAGTEEVGNRRRHKSEV